MRWNSLLRKLDDVRSAIRQIPNHQGQIPENHPILTQLESLHSEALILEQKKTLTVEVEFDENDNPILPEELKIRMVPRGPQQQARVDRVASHRPVNNVEMTTTVLPRTTPHINREPILEDATESTVEK